MTNLTQTFQACHLCTFKVNTVLCLHTLQTMHLPLAFLSHLSSLLPLLKMTKKKKNPAGTSHKKVFTSACRDGTLKNQPAIYLLLLLLFYVYVTKDDKKIIKIIKTKNGGGHMPSVSILITPMQMMMVTEPYFSYSYGLCVRLYL